ncbi:MAG TPA: phosphate starvation-inducible protein PhoH [Leptospiraceae bacterium]|nr:phosphate starvation-inducible protein PhoH [Spirochaetaceae bacterium]HBS03369.1 phosphate starvation-inducible protein PhoH [Leptospiraceae bacterium]|tara:strand:- start:5218 stop:6834 length:1617 start_codon:yes stop_codon:yes gene_type:complete
MASRKQDKKKNKSPRKQKAPRVENGGRGHYGSEQPPDGKPFVVVDTNVFLIDPSAYLKFPDSHLIIPLIVIEELDSFKRELTAIGKAAREIIRTLDDLRSKGPLTEGVSLENGADLRVFILEDPDYEIPPGLDHIAKDNYILACALLISERTAQSVRLVTKDADLRIKADVLGLEAIDYSQDQLDRNHHLYSGQRVFAVEDSLVDDFFSGTPLMADRTADPRPADENGNGNGNGNGGDNGKAPRRIMPPGKEEEPEEETLQIFKEKDGIHLEAPAENPFQINQYITLKSDSRSGLGRIRDDHKLHSLIERAALNISPRNREQRFAMDALLDPEIELVTLAGMAGTGKTLLAIACGLEQILEEKRYRRLLVARPVIPMGRDIGFLPGELGEKLRPWMQPIYDNLEFILGADDDPGNQEGDKRAPAQGTIQYLMQSGLLAVEPLTYIRGRSIPEQYVIVDEAQNLSPHEAKTIITRAGEGTKIVFTGDFFQIDHPYLNLYSNGITFTAQRMRNESIFAHVTLTKGERSRLAELASHLMEG